MFADLWIPYFSPQPVGVLFISPQHLYSLKWKLKCEGSQEEELAGWQTKVTPQEENRKQTPGDTWKQWLKWLHKRVLDSTTSDTWQWTTKRLPQTDRGTQTVHWKHSATNSLPGDCCSPAQVQDQLSSVQNQQKAGVTPPGRLLVLWQYIRWHLN